MELINRTRKSMQVTATFALSLAQRRVALDIPAPHPKLRFCVIVPVRNEEASLRPLVASLADQRDLVGASLDREGFEILLLLNNCTDRSEEVAAALQREYPLLKLYFASIDFVEAEAHVGRARQVLFDQAFLRLRAVGQTAGLILSTDADTRPAPDWIAHTETAIAAGACGVGGRILLDRNSEAALPTIVRRMLLLDIGYRRALEELRWLYAPEAHDPFPRHHQHFGGSFAVTAQAYANAGGIPLRRSSEDVALFRAIVESGGLFRHCPRVKVRTSARLVGRAQGGLADALKSWSTQSRETVPVLVESAAAAEVRLARLGLWSRDHPQGVPPRELTTTPDSPTLGNGAEIHVTLHALRERLVRLRSLSLPSRLALADKRRGGHSVVRFASERHA